MGRWQTSLGKLGMSSDNPTGYSECYPNVIHVFPDIVFLMLHPLALQTMLEVPNCLFPRAPSQILPRDR